MAGKGKPEARWEVLSRCPNGRETVTRVWAASRDLAMQGVAATLPHGHEVVDAAPPGNGLGSHPQP